MQGQERSYNADLPRSRGTPDGKRQTGAQGGSTETFLVAQDSTVRTLDIQDPVKQGSGSLEQRSPAMEDGGTQSNQTLPMATQHSDANIRMQIKLTKRQRPGGDDGDAMRTGGSAEVLMATTKKPGEPRPADTLELKYASQTEPIPSPSPPSAHPLQPEAVARARRDEQGAETLVGSAHPKGSGTESPIAQIRETLDSIDLHIEKTEPNAATADSVVGTPKEEGRNGPSHRSKALVSTTESLVDPLLQGTGGQLSKTGSKEKLATDAYGDPPLPLAPGGIREDMNIMIRHGTGAKGARKQTPSRSASRSRGKSRGSQHPGEGRAPSQSSSEEARQPEDAGTPTQPFAPVGTSQYEMQPPSHREPLGVADGQHRGYETADAGMDQTRVSFVNDVFAQMRTGKPGWHAKRFKKFPRFSIFLHRDEEHDHLEQHYISLNSRILSYLAQHDPTPPPLEMVDAGAQSARPGELESAPAADPAGAAESRTFEAGESAMHEQEEALGASQHLRLSGVESHTLMENSTQKTLEGTRVSQHSSRDRGLTVEAISNARIRASPAKHVRPGQADASSHAEPGERSDGSGEPLRGHTDYGETPAEAQLQQSNMVDPFDKVLLLKYIDNAILTSFRTLSKQNNVISHTLKVVHNRFAPTGMNRHIQKMYRQAHSALYPVSEAEGNDASSSGDELTEEALVRQILSKQAASRHGRALGDDMAELQALVDGGEGWQAHLTSGEDERSEEVS